MTGFREATAQHAVLAAVLALGSSGCAGVRVYSDPTLKKETGIRTFAPKPFLLVTRTGAEDKPIDLTVVYLPDTSNVLYIRQKAGWGSSELSVKLSNGIVTEFGTKSDSKVPESLTAMGSLLTAAAGAYKTAQEGRQIRDEAASAASRVDLDAAGAALRKVAEELPETVEGQAETSGVGRASAKSIATDLLGVASVLEDPTALARVGAQATVLDRLAARIGVLEILDSPVVGTALAYNRRIGTFATQVTRVANVVRPDHPQSPTFELFEIVQRAGKTVLLRLEIGE